jgi:hypothetical protein
MPYLGVRCKLKKENPPYVQAHLILLVPHKIKRAFTFPTLYSIISNICR